MWRGIKSLPGVLEVQPRVDVLWITIYQWPAAGGHQIVKVSRTLKEIEGKLYFGPVE
jgi:hypothetical protein